MKKYIITVSSELKALKINKMIENRSQWDIEPIFDGYPLHAGINYTSEPMVYECANEYAKNHKGARVEMMPYGKKCVLSREFSKFRFVDGFSVFLEEESGKGG
jgi:hypothetical protein